MIDKHNFDTYLFLSSKKFIICVIKIESFEIIYKKELIINDNLNEINFDKLNDFIKKNIFKLEKNLNNFVKNINIILESDEFFDVGISNKTDNNGDLIDFKNLLHPLKDLKNQCKKTLKDKTIIHMFIENYRIDNQDYSFLPKNLNCKNFSLDVRFICISNNLLKNLKEIFRKYQILVNKVLSANYLLNFQDEKNQKDIFRLAHETILGHNINEILLVDKSSENKGFFEKFFDFFS